LKAFLRTQGFESSTLKSKKYGHNLENLFQAAIEAKLLKIPAATRIPFDADNLARLIRTINPYYSDHLYRYLDEDFKAYSYIKNTEVLWPTLDYLQGLVEGAIVFQSLGRSIEEIDASVGEQVRKWREEQGVESTALVVEDKLFPGLR